VNPAPVHHHIRLRDQYFLNADRMVREHEWSKANEMLWGAVCQGIKALALATKGHTPSRHEALRSFMRELSKEKGEECYGRCFAHAERMHADFYVGRMAAEELAANIAFTRDLLARLEDDTRSFVAAHEPPAPEGAPTPEASPPGS